MRICNLAKYEYESLDNKGNAVRNCIAGANPGLGADIVMESISRNIKRRPPLR
jgi:hypothetical protein